MTFEYLWYYDTLRSPPPRCGRHVLRWDRGFRMSSVRLLGCRCCLSGSFDSYFILLPSSCLLFSLSSASRRQFQNPFFWSQLCVESIFQKFGGLTQISITPLKTNIHYPFKILQEWWLEEISFKLPINFRGLPSDILLDITAKIADSECLKLPKMIYSGVLESNNLFPIDFPKFCFHSNVWLVIQGQIYSPEGFNGCYRVMFNAYKVGALPNTVEESWGDLMFWRVMFSGRKNPNDYFHGLVGCVLMSTCLKNINICLFPESSHSLLHWKVLERLMMTMKMQLLLPCLLQVQETSIL